MLSGGIASWISQKRKMNPEISKTNFLSSISGALGESFFIAIYNDPGFVGDRS